jgi:hypothetical protein
MVILELAVASIAAVLTALSLKTLKTIKHLSVGNSFWIPVSVSGILFLTGSIISILHEQNMLPLTTMIDELVQTIRFAALSILLGGIYSYSKQVNKNLARKLATQETAIEQTPQTMIPIVRESPPIQERLAQERQKKENAHECQHQFGYLQTLPRNTPIPDECLCCDRIVECKHSIAKTLERQANSPPST